MYEPCDNERYLRYLLLLGEAGTLVLRAIVLREVGKRRQLLDVILSNNRTLLTDKIKTPHEYRRVYPNTSSVNADISTWDISTCAMVIKELFGKMLTHEESFLINEIQALRENVPGQDSQRMTIEEEEYRRKRLKLSDTLFNLAAKTDFNTHYLCLEVISKSGAASYSTETLLQKLSELHEFPSDMIENLHREVEVVSEEEDHANHNRRYIRERSFSVSYRKLGEKLTNLHTQSWYFGPLTRDETMEIFKNVETDGVFLVRDCLSNSGSYVLCVQEGGTLSNYLIRLVEDEDGIKYHIGEKPFQDVPSIIEFYSSHYLDKTPLIDAAPRQKVVTTSDFQGANENDLPFIKGEILEIISKGEDRWWYAKNAEGRIGIVPVPFITSLKEDKSAKKECGAERTQKPQKDESSSPLVPKRLPAKAVVTKARISNPYDKSQLTLHEGDIVLVTDMFANGQWRGECNGDIGVFPYRYVKFLDEV
ncbi:adapter molecule Crk-like [Ruditapes philippinarum]|uniref:adapter molecule Crk-like n=1 Tax=Ruditapes philippinarum TaxID=129788 RepID=UPI00295BE42C|nr:adapter molecule Crk-like [Ruditapes philippinarum]XP_060577319.1 adapter molecule Crk-like [Ruditapes philippinarum]